MTYSTEQSDSKDDFTHLYCGQPYLGSQILNQFARGAVFSHPLVEDRTRTKLTEEDGRDNSRSRSIADSRKIPSPINYADERKRSCKC